MKEGKCYLSITLCSLLFASSTLFANETKKLDSVTIMGKTSSDYTTVEKPSISRGNISLENTSKSIQVFNEDFLEDYQPQSIEEIVTLSSNVISFGSNNGRENVFAIRGFMNLPVLKDGLNLPSTIANPEIYGLERIEVLKGPDSLQYGEGGAGGLINLVKKKPDQKELFGEIVLEATSQKKYSPKIDVGGSINEDGSARFRLVSAYSNQSDYKNFNTDIEQVYLAPSLAYDLNKNHTLTFVAEYFDVKKPTDYGTPVKSDGSPAGDYDYITSHPDDDMRSTQKTIGFDLESSFVNWNSNFRYRYVDYEMDIGDTYTPFAYNETTDSVSRMYSYMTYHNKEHLFQYTVDKSIELEQTKHNFTFGIDYTILNQEADGYFARPPVYSVDYSNQIFESSMTTRSDHTLSDFVDGFDINKYGAFIQDSIEVTDNFTVNLGLRYDLLDIDPEKQNSYKKSSTTPTLGLVHKFNDNTSLFFNYSESFRMQDVRNKDASGKLLDPEEGKGFELGLRHKLLDNKLNFSTSLFKIDKENVGIYDSTTLSYLPSEKQTSKGIEFDIAGEIQDGWSVIASYGYTMTNVEKYFYRPTYYYDKEIVGVPRHSASIFTTYYLTPKFYIGGGARYIGKRYVDYANSVEVDADVILNASLGYREKNWSFDFSVKNLTDREYYESVGSNGLGSAFRNNELGTPRTFLATLKYKF